MNRLLILSVVLALVYAQNKPDPAKWRTHDGYGNNVANPTWGTPGIHLRRMSPAVYGDGISTDRLNTKGQPLPGARLVSNTIHPPPPQGVQPLNIRGLTDVLTYWGQFMDHDLDLTGGPFGSALPLEPIAIPVPKGDLFFDVAGTGTANIVINRSIFDNTTSTSATNPREQINLVTAFMDGSQVYGSSNAVAAALRSFTGGLMLTSMLNGKEMPPFVGVNGTVTMANDPGKTPISTLYMLGDVRGNENPALTSLHTLFLREHNRKARALALANPTWTDEELYQEARRWVIALIQKITIHEYYPVTVGDASPPYPGYNATIDPSTITEFSTGGFRYGHSEVAEFVWRLDKNGVQIPEGHLLLKNSFFNSPTTVGSQGIEPILRGLASFTQNAVDIYFVDDLRNFLFGLPGAGGLDLAAVNIERGRDHGLPGYNDIRVAYGLAPNTAWNQVNPDPKVYTLLSTAYASIDDCDIYTCGLAEFHDYSNVGETFTAIIMDQYDRFIQGDRFWFENPGYFTDAELADIGNQTLADVFIRNTDILPSELQCFVFSQPDGCGKTVAPLAPGPAYQTYDWDATVRPKTAAHQYFGKGHSYGFLINGVEGPDLHIVRGRSYFVHVESTCAHSLVFSNVPEKGQTKLGGNQAYIGDGDAFNAVLYQFGCRNWHPEMALISAYDTPDYLYYACDLHPLMGGQIYVTGTMAAAGVITPAFLFAAALLVLLGLF